MFERPNLKPQAPQARALAPHQSSSFEITRSRQQNAPALSPGPASSRQSMQAASSTPGIPRNFTGTPIYAPREASSAGSAPYRPPAFILQAKLAIGLANDPLELEADRLSAEVLRSSGTSGPIGSAIGIAPPALRRCSAHSPEKKCPQCMEEEATSTSATQARAAQLARDPAASDRSPETAPDAVLDVLRSPGQPLDRAQRTFYESRLGHNLCSVRLHVDPAAARSAAEVRAHAFAAGDHVVFAGGRYQPATREGQQLIAHELIHTIQQRSTRSLLTRREESPSTPNSAAHALPAPVSHAAPQLSRQVDPQAKAEPTVGSVMVYLGGGPGKASIVFTTVRGSRSYTLDSVGNLEPGQYPVKVKVMGAAKVQFTFDLSSGKLFHFNYSIKPGQASPATLFAKQGTVHFVVTKNAAPVQEKRTEREPEQKQEHGTHLSVADRAREFKRLVKAAGKVRMAENRKALSDWSTFLQKKLTPAQVNSMVRAQEVLDLQQTATREGGRALDAYDQAVSTSNPLRREMAIGQVHGQYRACTGCHLTVQADQLEKENPGLAHSGLPAWTPINRDLRAFAGEQATNPVARPGTLKTTDTEGLAKKDEIHDPTRPNATAASAALATIQPYLKILGPGPGFYNVLPADILEHYPDPKNLLAFILARIEARREAFAKFSEHIDDPDFDYLTLRPIVRDLLPLQDTDVQALIGEEVKAAEEWEHTKSILMWGVALGLLLLTIFPPTSAIGIAGVAAVEGAMAAYAVTSGLESMKEGYWLSQTTGASNVTDPEQQEAAGMMMAMGLVSIVIGGLGLKGVLAKGLKLLRIARAASAAGAATTASATEIIDGIEGDLGGNRFKVSEISSGNPKAKVTSPTGETLYDGPLKDMPQEGFGAGKSGPVVKPDLKMFAKQRASALEQSALDTETRAADLEARAARVKNPAKAAEFKDQAAALRKEASSLRTESHAYASNAKSPLADLPTGAEIDAEIDKIAAGKGAPQQKIEVPLNKAERTGNLERLSRGMLKTSRGRVVFRVEGSGSRTLLNVDAAGAVKVTPGTTYLNFGSVERALEFLAKRGPGARIVAFEVDEAWAQSVRSSAVPETNTKFLTGKTPKLVDVTYADDQFEIPAEMLPEMEKFIVPGSAKVVLTK